MIRFIGFFSLIAYLGKMAQNREDLGQSLKVSVKEDPSKKDSDNKYSKTFGKEIELDKILMQI